MRVDVGDAEVKVKSLKARALLAYLATRLGEAVPRGVLAELLWGSRSETQARASLRQTLATLRRAIGPRGQAAIVATPEAVALDPDSVWIDVRAVESAAESQGSDLPDLATCYRGEFLEGLSLDEISFDRWLIAEREKARRLACKVFEALMQIAESERRLEDAITHGTKLLALDPLQEHVHRSLMRLYAAQGRHDAALALYEKCRQELAEQLGVTPEEATVSLVQSLRRERRTSQAGPGAASKPIAPEEQATSPVLPRRPSIAVLPFHSIQQDEEGGYFGEGVAEDIIIELSRNKDFFVVARHSSFRYRAEPSDLVAVGRELGVRYLLLGSVRRLETRIRLSVHLVNAESGMEIWAERYDRDLEDIFDVQTEVARTVTATISGRIAFFDHEARWTTRPEHLDAYDYLLRGMQCLQLYTPECYATARQHFEKAAKIDPNYARPYGYLCVVGVYEWFWTMAEGGLRDVLAVGEKAIAMDPHESRSHMALGVAHLFSRDHERAIYHFDQSLALNANDDLAITEHGRLLMYLDQPEAGLMRVREAMRLNPFHPNWYWNIYGRCLHTAGRYHEAIEAFRKIDTPQFWILAYLAACHAMIGEEEKASQYLRQCRDAKPDFTLDTFGRILPYSKPETRERFLDTLRRAGLPD